MSNLTICRIVAVLKKVPEKKLAIFDLAPQLVDENGKPDIARCLDRQADINLAVLEVQAYVRATKEVRHALGNIGGSRTRPDYGPGDDLDEEDDE